MFHWLSYTDRHPAPKSIQDVYRELYEALVHPQGQYPCEDYHNRWIYERERRLNDGAPELLDKIYEGLVQRINSGRTEEEKKIYNQKSRIFYHPRPGSTYTYDLSSGVKAFHIPGLLPWSERQDFLDTDPESLIWKAPETVVEVSVSSKDSSESTEDVDMSDD
jgi:hypothetical protein